MEKEIKAVRTDLFMLYNKVKKDIVSEAGVGSFANIQSIPLYKKKNYKAIPVKIYYTQP